MAKVNLSLLFNGNCEEAFNLYKSTFGGEFLSVVKYGDIPLHSEMPPLSEETKNKIENITLPISQETFLMGADVVGEMAKATIFGNNFSIYIEADNSNEAEKIFKQLSGEGHITMPLGKAHWGDYFGMCTDKFGINWLINCAANKA